MNRQDRSNSYRPKYISKSVSRKWSLTETKLFYDLLRHYGLDFTLISYHPTFYQSRNQKEICNKYKKEIKKNPSAINSILNEIYNSGLFGTTH
jgi:hypothetical protein